jgi:NAD-dependent dihydropyrimidine dehydrogenase PreA subunit
VNGEQGSSAMAAGRLDKEKARRAARHPARPGQNCSAAPGESRPVVDHGACEGKRDCVEVCPYDVFEVRQIDDSDFAKLSFLGKMKSRAHGRQTAYTPQANHCQSCGLCVVACPEKAITLALYTPI